MATTNTVRLHRVLRAPPERLYRAFIEPSAFERWLPPFGFTGKVHSMDPVVGGAWRMSFTAFGSGHSHSFGGKYLELVPGQRIAYDASFDDPNLPGTMKNHRDAHGRVLRHRHVRRAGRHPRPDSRGDVLPGLAGVACRARPAGRAEHSGLSAEGLQSPGIWGGCSSTALAAFLRSRMLSISTASEKAIAKYT